MNSPSAPAQPQCRERGDHRPGADAAFLSTAFLFDDGDAVFHGTGGVEHGVDDERRANASELSRRYPDEATRKIEWVRRVSRCIVDYHAGLTTVARAILPFVRALLLRHTFGMLIVDYIDLLEPLFVTCRPGVSYILGASQSIDAASPFYRDDANDSGVTCLRRWIAANPEVYDSEVPFFAQLVQRFGKYLTNDCALRAVDDDNDGGDNGVTSSDFSRDWSGVESLSPRRCTRVGASERSRASSVAVSAHHQRRLDWLYTAVTFYHTE
jgi:hypothetical protein